MIGKQGDDAIAFTQNIFHKAVQDPLRPHFNKYAGARIVEGVQALDELNRRRHLFSQQADHVGHDSRTHGVKVAGHVGHNRNDGRTQSHARQNLRQRIAGRRHNPGMEGMTYLQRAGHITGVADRTHGLFNALRRPADYGFLGAVDIRNHHIIVDGGKDLLDLVDRPEYRRHHAVVIQRTARHFIAARADSLQRFFKGNGAGCDQGAIFAKTVAHHHIGRYAVGAQQTRQRRFGREHGGLGNRRLL